jgi:hypothetical protein
MKKKGYFIYANTEKKPVMRFFDHWFEVNDFLKMMNWDYLKATPHIEIYKQLDEEELKKKND